jgi:hypothetical protein
MQSQIERTSFDEYIALATMMSDFSGFSDTCFESQMAGQVRLAFEKLSTCTCALERPFSCMCSQMLFQVVWTTSNDFAAF